MLKLSIRQRALSELLIAGVFWGFGFTATVWALQGIGPAAIIFYRFTFAFIAGIGILKIQGHQLRSLKKEFWLGLWPGLLLGVTLLFQSFGLQWTTATKSSFITTLYVIMVPFLARFTHAERIPWKHWLCVAVALVGVILIVEMRDFHLGLGDSLTLVCAFFAAVHILVVDRAAHASANHFALNTFQAFWCALCAIPLLFLDPRWDLSQLHGLGWVGLLTLAFGNSMIAFYLQFKAQKFLSPSLASLLFLLESPFSAIFAVSLIGETLSPVQIFGAILIFVACGIATQIQPTANPQPLSTKV